MRRQVLRPFIGWSQAPTRFLRESAFRSNAYVEVLSTLGKVLGI